MICSHCHQEVSRLSKVFKRCENCVDQWFQNRPRPEKTEPQLLPAKYQKLRMPGEPKRLEPI